MSWLRFGEVFKIPRTHPYGASFEMPPTVAIDERVAGHREQVRPQLTAVGQRFATCVSAEQPQPALLRNILGYGIVAGQAPQVVQQGFVVGAESGVEERGFDGRHVVFFRASGRVRPAHIPRRRPRPRPDDALKVASRIFRIPSNP